MDIEFRDASTRLIDRALAGHALLLISDVTRLEIASAPPDVQAVLQSLPESAVERVFQDEESEILAEEYLAEHVVSRKMLLDAMHIAIATVERADVLISWNYKHIVNLDRIRRFNAVNVRLGYPLLEIRSPLEIWANDNEDV